MDDGKLVYWLLGAMFTMVVIFIKYMIGRFNALETKVNEDRLDFIKHQDIERYMRPLENQMGQVNSRLDKLLDMQIAAIKEGNKK